MEKERNGDTVACISWPGRHLPAFCKSSNNHCLSFGTLTEYGHITDIHKTEMISIVFSRSDAAEPFMRSLYLHWCFGSLVSVICSYN